MHARTISSTPQERRGTSCSEKSEPTAARKETRSSRIVEELRAEAVAHLPPNDVAHELAILLDHRAVVVLSEEAEFQCVDLGAVGEETGGRVRRQAAQALAVLDLR